jgi:dTDP-glucose pyrophosphorylase
LVLAAGMGSRYGGLKQIDPVGPNGETIIDYSIYDAQRAGFGKVVFVIRRQIEAPFREAIGRRFENRLAVEYVFQELDKLPAGASVPPGRTRPWGTTHALLMADGVIHEPFAAINADDFYGRDSFRVLADYLRTGADDYAMVGFVLRSTLSEHGSVSRGVCERDAEGYLCAVTELTKIEKDGTGAVAEGRRLSGDEIVSMNFWGFTPTVFPQSRRIFEEFLQQSRGDPKSECFIPNTVSALIATGQARVRVLQSRSHWFGVTYHEDRPLVAESVRRLVSRGEYPTRLWA